MAIKKGYEVKKGWGSELIWASNDLYCGKFLNFNNGSISSMHFHAKKTETWYVLSGMFELSLIDTKTSEVSKIYLKVGDIVDLKPLEPHQLRCMESGCIVEVSSPDSSDDNYRVRPGDSQK
jgi:mannose-6-phosphate isomerase-like protein (cupin superfamily)